MRKPCTLYIPKDISEVMDLLGDMMLSAPKFVDDSGYFPDQNIDSEFFALNEGLKLIRERVGEEDYSALVELSNRMRAHFEADPEDKTGDGIKGRDCIVAMEDLLKAAAQRKRR
ncbi:MAG: hypothetical protein H6917_08045 [Novosphingobium sp.]|nr:hypothetical protein [Novosphingobium sp.]MCP5402327.1 hypothetical protein [Novosphingobium sp.]